MNRTSAGTSLSTSSIGRLPALSFEMFEQILRCFSSISALRKSPAAFALCFARVRRLVVDQASARPMIGASGVLSS